VLQPTKEFIRALAEASGLTIPEERLELVLRQYENLLRSVNELSTLQLPLEAEPAFVFGLHSTPPPSTPRPREE
jgi:hypothetical protein